MISAESAYLFRHAVLRDAAYQLQAPAARALLHHLSLHILEAVLGPDERDEAALELASHAGQALEDEAISGREDLAGKQLNYLRTAAVLATERFHNALASEIWQRVYRHPRSSATLRVDAALARASVHSRVGETGLALEAIAEGRDAIARWDGDDRERLIREARLAEAHGQSLFYGTQTAESIEHTRRAIELYRQAGDAPGLAGALSAIARSHGLRGNHAEARGAAEQAVGMLEPHGDSPALASALITLATTIGETAGPRERIAMIDRALPMLSSAQVTARIQGMNGLARCLAQEGDTVGAIAELERTITVAVKAGARQAEGMVRANLAGDRMYLGEFEPAEQHYRLALQAARETGSAIDEARILGNLGNLYVAWRRGDEAESFFRLAVRCVRKLDAPVEVSYIAGNAAEVFIESGKLGLAERAFATCRAMLAAGAAPALDGVYAALQARLELLVGKYAEAAANLVTAGRAVGESTNPLWHSEYYLFANFARIADECARGLAGLDAPMRHLEAMRAFNLRHRFDSNSGAGNSFVQCEAVMHELEQAAAQNRPALLVGGQRTEGMSPAKLLAVAACRRAAGLALPAPLEPIIADLARSHAMPDWKSSTDPDFG